MTINSVTSGGDIYEAMLQQAAALHAAQAAQTPVAPNAAPQPGQPSSEHPAVGRSTEAGSFARSLSAETRLTDHRPLALPAPARPDAQLLQSKIADAYRSPWANANSLVVQTRSPAGLSVSVGGAKGVAAAAQPEAETTKPTYVEVHSVYVDAADEESARSSRNPLIQFASRLYQNVTTTSQRSAAGVFIGSSFSAVA
jgi:hypothetical protein